MFDGFSSSSTLLNYLHNIYPNEVENDFSYGLHEGKQHGLEDMMERIPNETRLVITPDAGSNDEAFHKQLFDKGIDVLVLDHHHCEIRDDYEYACIVNNNAVFSNKDNYPNKTLCGAAVVYKFCKYIDSSLGTEYADNYLDLVATALITDMMDLKSFETRRLIDKGLACISNPYLSRAIEAADYSISRYGGLCPHTVGFYIGPQVNATIRFGEMEDKLLVFESMLDYKGNELIPSTKRGHKGEFETRAIQAVRTASNLKKKQDSAVAEIVPIIQNIIEEKELYKNKIIAVKLKKGLIENKNITGLVATKLVSMYNHPVLLLNETEYEGQIAWMGSGRNVSTPEFADLRGFMEDSGLVFLAAGHAGACGCGINQQQFEEFIDYSNKELSECDFSPCSIVDFIWQANEVNFNSIIDIAELNMIYGQGLSEPKVVIENINITTDNIKLVGAKCPTINIDLGNNIKAIKFWAEEDYNKILPSESGVTKINILGTCAINEFNGNINAQINIEDYEIVNKMEYYF